MQQDEQFEGVRCDITMHRTLFVSRQEDTSDEDVLDTARREIILPHDALRQVADILSKSGLRISGLDLKDWIVDDVKYTKV